MWCKKKEKKTSVEEVLSLKSKYDKLENDIKELEKADEFLCPFMGVGALYGPLKYHNPLVKQAINEKIERLRKEQKDLKF